MLLNISWNRSLCTITNGDILGFCHIWQTIWFKSGGELKLMAVSQTCNLQFSLKVSVSDDRSREEDNCTWRFFEFLCTAVTPRWHQGRVSVSFYLPVTGWSQACPHAWDTTKQRHLTLSNRRHVLRCRKPSDFVTCGTLPLWSARATIQSSLTQPMYWHSHKETLVWIPVIWEVFTKWLLSLKTKLWYAFTKNPTILTWGRAKYQWVLTPLGHL